MESKAKLEHIVHSQDESFRFFVVEGQNFDHAYHYHPEIELTLILESKGMRLIGDTFQSFGVGDLCLLGENLPHLYRNDTPAAGEPPACALVLQFSRDCCGGLFDNTPELQTIGELLNRADCGLQFDRNTARVVGDHMRQLLTASAHSRISIFLEILGFLVRMPAEPIASVGYQPNLNNHKSERISRACHYIMDRFHEPVSLVETASHVGMSPSAFSRFFQRATNQSFRDFLSGIRLGYARRLLLETNLPVTEVSLSSGFSSLENFIRRFKKANGISPLKFRQQAAEVTVDPKFNSTPQ